MDSGQCELKQRKSDNATNKTESESGSETKDVESKADIPPVIKTKEEYFDALRVWLQQVQLQQMAYTYFPYYLSSNLQANANGNMFMPQMSFLPPEYASAFQTMPMFNQQTTNTSNAGEQVAMDPNVRPPPIFLSNVVQPNRQVDNARQHLQYIMQYGGFEYVIAPIWKRFIAETIDVIILFIIKLMIVFMMIDIFNVEVMNLDFDSLKSSFEEDYLDILSLSSDLLLVEILTKVLVCIYEALWTAHGNSAIGGATPGKIIMGIRILYVEAVVPLGQMNVDQNFNASTQMRALMYPAANPGFRRALFRAIAKNMLMTLMFPMCFVLLFFRNNRTGYDVMTKTIVVEENAAPIRRQL